MGGFVLGPFQGEIPKIGDRNLPQNSAQTAQNLVLTTGKIQPIKKPRVVYVPSNGPWLSVYRAENQGNEKWYAWSKDVDIDRAPLSPDAEPRYYWTGDGEPRYSTFANFPTPWALGVPSPQSAPIVTPTGGGGATVSRLYVYTFITALGEESGPSPDSGIVTGHLNDTWAVSGMVAFPSNNGNGSATFSSGVTTFSNTGSHWLRAGDEIVLLGQTVTVAQTLSNSTYTVLGNYSSATSWARKAPWNTVGMKRILYRSAGTNQSYQMVAFDVGTTYSDTLGDAQIIGDELLTSSWEPPPAGLKGCMFLPNGCMVGFLKNEVYYSEPFQPHAFPVRFRRKLNFDVVGMASYGTTVIAGTKSVPYILDGAEPQFVTAESINQTWPCSAKKGVISTGDAVIYPTSYGLAYIGRDGARIFTNDLFTRQEWAPLNPQSMIVAMAEGRIFVKYQTIDGNGGVMIFDLENPGLGLTRLAFNPTEIYADRVNGQCYLVDAEGVKQYDAATGFREDFFWLSGEVHLPKPMNMGAAKIDFESDISPSDLEQMTEEFNVQVQANIDSVESPSYNFAGVLNSVPLNSLPLNQWALPIPQAIVLPNATFTLYLKTKDSQTTLPDWKIVFSKILNFNDSSFRLPAGLKVDSFKIGMSGTLDVVRIKISETMSGLNAL